jgi:hypothetical protein
VRILARAWIYVIWRCWQDGTAYDPAKHTALQRLLDQQRAAQAAGGPVTSAIIAALRAHAADLHPDDGQIPCAAGNRASSPSPKRPEGLPDTPNWTICTRMYRYG